MHNRAQTMVIDELRARIGKIGCTGRRSSEFLPFGIDPIERPLPGGGLAFGALHEVAGGGNGALDGAAAALFVAGIAARTSGRVLWCLTRQDLFAPGLMQAELSNNRVLFVECRDEAGVLECFEEALRCSGLGAVVGETARMTMAASRRLQLAVEGSGGSAKGDMFITIEDESGVANLVVWVKTFEKFRPVVLGASMMAVYGKIQREGQVVHLVTPRLSDLSAELVSIGQRDAAFPLPHGRGDEFHHGSPTLDPRGMPKTRDIIEPYGHIDQIRVKKRDFR